MWTFFAALIAVCGVVIGSYLTNFVAEDFRRHRNRTALAAALAGELDSNSQAVQLLKGILQFLHSEASGGKDLVFPKFEPPGDPIYDASIPHLGLLGSSLVRDVVFTFQNMKAFRSTFGTICNSEKALDAHVVAGSLVSCMASLDRAEHVGTPLLAKLTALAAENYEFKIGRLRFEFMSA